MTISISCIDTLNYEQNVFAVEQTLKCLPIERLYWFADIPYPKPLSIPVDWIRIKKYRHEPNRVFNHWYSHVTLRVMPAVVNTDHNLIIHPDGFAVNPDAWTDEFLDYDYIGAPWVWWASEGENIGNGGFSLRSRKLYDALIDWQPGYRIADWPDIDSKYIITDRSGHRSMCEDNLLAGPYRKHLEQHYGLKWPSVDLAHRFAIEGRESYDSTWFKKSLGFHSNATAKHYGFNL
jgi:hypothetical protein